MEVGGSPHKGKKRKHDEVEAESRDGQLAFMLSDETSGAVGPILGEHAPIHEQFYSGIESKHKSASTFISSFSHFPFIIYHFQGFRK